jgi:hypothetical protein
MLGKPMRAAIGGGKAVISSSVKVAAAGASLDVPLGWRSPGPRRVCPADLSPLGDARDHPAFALR